MKNKKPRQKQISFVTNNMRGESTTRLTIILEFVLECLVVQRGSSQNTSVVCRFGYALKQIQKAFSTIDHSLAIHGVSFRLEVIIFSTRILKFGDGDM